MRIGNIRHAGLRRLFRKNDPSGIPVPARDKISKMLAFLQDMGGTDEFRDFPGWRPHRLKGERKGAERWSLRVTGNWRLTFRIDGDLAFDLDFEDYH